MKDNSIVHSADQLLIHRLNSTLSVRIEELNAQISTLYVENLRLRASEIALTAQLKKEREKSRKILTDTEAAVSLIVVAIELMRTRYCTDTESHEAAWNDPEDF